jgi:Zn ribbon nucleic-acid-binding protein
MNCVCNEPISEVDALESERLSITPARCPTCRAAEFGWWYEDGLPNAMRRAYKSEWWSRRRVEAIAEGAFDVYMELIRQKRKAA